MAIIGGTKTNLIAQELEGAAFGITDGVICALGLIFGVAIATANTDLVILSTFAGGVANSFANSIGVFISQSAERGVQMQRKKNGHAIQVHTKKEILMSAVFSFMATLIVLAILISPFLLFDIGFALILTTIAGILILFFLGIYIAKITDEDPIKEALLFVGLGLAGVAIGYLIGSLFKMRV